ncbi:hypothetical protein L218DRAFT_930793 [Marasmius fiardii PR-910]|nr:hypothetical protein L218DRAFT_930793 [Marasmius fiardii PR-910]
MILTVVVHENPAPAPSATRNPVFTLKNYTENEGILEKLEAINVVKQTGTTYKQGFVTIPLVEVLLSDSKMIHVCAKCETWETVGETRFQRCSRCRKTYYCSPECQLRHWTDHKAACKLLAKGDHCGVLNKQRAEMTDVMKEMGFTFLEL